MDQGNVIFVEEYLRLNGRGFNCDEKLTIIEKN